MGFFRRRKNKKDISSYQNIDEEDDHSGHDSPPRMTMTYDSYNYDQSLLSSTYNNTITSYPTSPSSYSSQSTGDEESNPANHHPHLPSNNNNSGHVDDEQSGSCEIITLDDLPTLIQSIQTCEQTYDIQPAKALRSLFTLSEDEQFHEINRIRMIRESDGQLLPTLFQFLQRCEPSSSEQYLVLLVLNNVSIPNENKRLVAIGMDNKRSHHSGAVVLGRLWCEYPNISLIGIIMVNLSFCDGGLRKVLVDDLYGDIQFVEALVYVLKVRSYFVLDFFFRECGCLVHDTNVFLFMKRCIMFFCVTMICTL